jgi:peptidoglycan/LPS O-acetylase OafA/YrhL
MVARFAGVDEVQDQRSRVAASSRESVNLDVLRSAAVLMVLGVHLLLYFRVTHWGPLPLLEMGQWGVLIFFFHTSLVLMRSLSRMSRDTAGRPSFAEFALRRGFRLLPLCWLVVGFVAITNIPAGHLKESAFVAVPLEGSGWLYNVLLIQNLTGTESAVATLWSLPYEMQMYLLLPALFAFAQAARTRTVVCAWLGTAVLAVCWRFEDGERMRDALWLVPCFFAGIVAFKLSSQLRPTWPALTWPLLLAGLTLLYLSWSKPCIGALGCLTLGLCQPRIHNLQLRPLRIVSQRIAQYSYGVYLTHLICIWGAFERLGDLPLILRWAIFVVSATALPVVLYHGLEHPMIVLGARLAAKLRRSGLHATVARVGRSAEPAVRLSE